MVSQDVRRPPDATVLPSDWRGLSWIQIIGAVRQISGVSSSAGGQLIQVLERSADDREYPDSLVASAYLRAPMLGRTGREASALIADARMRFAGAFVPDRRTDAWIDFGVFAVAREARSG